MSDNRSRHDRLAVRLSLIISRLMAGESLSLKTLSDEFGVTERTLQRDFHQRLVHLGGNRTQVQKTGQHAVYRSLDQKLCEPRRKDRVQAVSVKPDQRRGRDKECTDNTCCYSSGTQLYDGHSTGDRILPFRAVLYKKSGNYPPQNRGQCDQRVDCRTLDQAAEQIAGKTAQRSCDGSEPDPGHHSRDHAKLNPSKASDVDRQKAGKDQVDGCERSQ